MKTAFAAFSVAVVLVAASGAYGDGMIVPVRSDLAVRGEWAVKYHHVTIRVRDQVAQVHIDQVFVNLGKAPLEVEYLFPVPPGAGISKMTLMADGKEMPAKLLKAEDARRIYEDIVARKKDPALLEYVGYGLYKTSVFPLPPGQERRVIIEYTAECRKDRDLVTVHYPLNTEKFSAKAIEDVKVTVEIESARDIGPVYSPTHELQVERKSARHVVATYHVTDAIPATDLEVLYQDGSDDVGATVISHRPKKDADGYFMVLVSPRPQDNGSKVMPKDIVFVLDHSGSMRGDKMEQARQGMRWIVENLNDADRFNVISFSDGVETLFNVGLVEADAEHVAKARDLIGRLDASGGTNVHAALTKAFSLLPDDSERPAYVVFVTDGKPTVGAVTDEAGIRKAAGEANQARARLFVLGVGYDVNTRLLDLLAQDGRGLSEYVKASEPLEAKVSGLYAKIRNPVMTGLSFSLEGAGVKDVYPPELGDLFDGRQIVLVGRYTQGGRRKLVISGNYQGREQSFEYPVELAEFSEDNSAAYLERLWAMRRVGFLMDQIALHGENHELIDELIALSRDYGIMTPYTSFLAEEDTNLADKLELRKAGERFGLSEALSAASGEAGQRNAVVRQELRGAKSAAAPAAAAPKDAQGRVLGAPLSGMIGNTNVAAYEADRVESVGNLRQVANYTLYRRQNRWVTPDLAEVDVEAAGADVKTIRQFDPEYFELARANNRSQNELLATQQAGEELLVSLRGQVYRILPARQ